MQLWILKDYYAMIQSILDGFPENVDSESVIAHYRSRTMISLSCLLSTYLIIVAYVYHHNQDRISAIIFLSGASATCVYFLHRRLVSVYQNTYMFV